MINNIVMALQYTKSTHKDILFAQGSQEFPITFKELLNKIRWQLGRK